MERSGHSGSSWSRFTRDSWLAGAVFIAFAIAFVLYVRTEQQIEKANADRQRVFLLAQVLRQSTTDLGRLARAYAVTGNAEFKTQYRQVLDILEGRQPPPDDYASIYLKPALQGDQGAAGSPIPLLERIRLNGVTAEEFTRLIEAHDAAAALRRTELAAIRLVDRSSSASAREQAIRMLHDDAYRNTEAAALKPFAEFQKMLDQRTLRAVRETHADATRMLWLLALSGALLALLLWNLRRDLLAILGARASELHARLVHLGSGDFSAPIPVPSGLENSVLGWLSQTQRKLAGLDAQRQEAEARNQRLTQLYAALSQCNQAIVRCEDEVTLLTQICRDVVALGGMRMAWVGMCDAGSGSLVPVAFFGAGTDYLQGLRVSVDPDLPAGRGPAGQAFRTDRPFWCQDFQQDPATAPWHSRGAEFGWRASAAIPLHRGGRVVGIFSLYANVPGAFDEEVQTLLVEMGMDIDHALKNFDREKLRERAEQALRESEHRLRAIFDTEPECIKVTDLQGRLLEMNPAGLAMLEADSLEQLRNHSFAEYVLPRHHEAFSALQRRVTTGDSGTLEFEIVALKGTHRWLETHAAPMRDAAGNVVMLLGITRDITARKQAEERIRYLAHFDALTGLPNRTQLDDRARYAISLAQRNRQQLAVMFLDLDHFKDINDTLGHRCGDALLVELAGRLRQGLRAEDTVCRLGGDEFIFLLYGADAAAAARTAQKVLDVIARPYDIDRHELNVSGSIGIALFPTDGEDLETLSRSADAAMYQVKQEGRNGYRFFTAEMQARSAQQLQLANALRHALPQGQLQLHYQPQISLQDGRLIGVEALLRWTHPELGSVPPARFIPAAEEGGMILPIGEWVLREAVRQARRWLRQGLAPMVMAVNLSAAQFRHPDLPQLVGHVLEEEELPPEYLELELTESVAMHDPQAAVEVMNRLHDRGVRMSIDDFGTGYSSLSYLKRFKANKLKIDQSFVRDISTDMEDRAIVSGIIQLAHSLGLRAIAEGVETEGQLDFLRKQGCDEIQGYYYCKPLPADEFEAFAQARARA